MILLKSWIGHIVKDNFMMFYNILNKDKEKEEKKQEDAGMKSYIGSWLGYAGAQPQIKTGDKETIERDSEQIQIASE